MNNCLIIAFYNGIRDGEQNKLFDEYIALHMKLYEKISNNLSKIYIVIALDHIEKDYFSEYSENIVFYYRKNKNLSFGSWVDIMNLTDHDYYFYVKMIISLLKMILTLF